MTWWEVEQIAVYVHNLEDSIGSWSLSGSQMRHEQVKLAQITQKLLKNLPRIEDAEKKELLVELKYHIKELSIQLEERLKRPLSNNISPRNLLS